jgi:hypothetical protein
MIILNTVNDMKTKVIDIRKHDPEKVVAYWVSQGGKKTEEDACDTPDSYPYCGIDVNGDIDAWPTIHPSGLCLELIDLPEEEFKTGDRVVDERGEVFTFIGILDNDSYVKAFNGEVLTARITKFKHYKEPELFEGWVNLYPGGEVGGPHKTKKIAQEYGAYDVRIIKVREVKDED